MPHKNPEDRKEYKKIYDTAHENEIKAYREARKKEKQTYDKVYSELHRETKLARNKAYNADNKERVRIRQREWREINKDKLKEYREEHRKSISSKSNDRVRANKEFANSFKIGNSCSICGFNDIRALQFHHIDSSTKLFSIGNCGGRSREVIMREIQKCLLICANCHFILHSEEREK
jgi:hypothetical protein